eukprot:7391431-Prymnesium_polylepis.1
MTPNSRRKARAEAADGVIFRLSTQHPSGEKSMTQLPYANSAGLYMRGLSDEALDFIKSSLRLAPKAVILMTARWNGQECPLRNITELEGFMGLLRQSSTRDLEKAGNVVMVNVQVQGRVRLKAADAPERPTETAKKALEGFCYLGSSHGAEGEWTLHCDNVLVQQPSVLKTFLGNRRLVGRALGDPRYFLNPVRGICPFAGCNHARQSLNAINAFWWLYSEKKKSHWITVHGKNPAVPLLIKRLEKLRSDPNISDERLNQVAVNPLTSEWMAEHHEEVGEDGVRSLNDMSLKDLFEPGDISSNLAKAQWAERKKEEYKVFLEQRAREREAQAEEEAAASRARAAQAMGVEPVD